MRIATALLLCAAAAGQTNAHVRLLARLNPGGGFSDCWGHASAGGREHALLCGTDGTWVIDCSDPTRPVVRAQITATASGWSPSPWRDVKTWRDRAYVISEGGGGVQIIDLRDPDRPRLLSTWGKSLWANAHNLAIDPQTGIAWVCGTDRGTLVLDLADPDNPKQIATFGSGRYVHDAHLHQGVGHVADLRRNEYLLVDLTRLPQTPILGQITMPGARLAHNAWVDRDGALAVTTNEVAGGPLGVFDVQEPRRPRLLGRASIGPPAAIIHNAVLQDRLAHVSYYTEGYQVFDLGDPTQPLHVGSYDTFAGATGGFNGAWGCYPLQPSGVVYVSDMRSGLWIFAPRAVASPYGEPTPGTGGRSPRLATHGASYVGNRRFGFRVETAAKAAGLLVVAGRPASTNLNGLRLHVAFTPSPPLAVAFTTDDDGRASVPLPIPADKTIDGVRVYAQCAVLDANGPLGLAASRGLDVEVFALK